MLPKLLLILRMWIVIVIEYLVEKKIGIIKSQSRVPRSLDITYWKPKEKHLSNGLKRDL